jgi:hypothetical protein
VVGDAARPQGVLVRRKETRMTNRNTIGGPHGLALRITRRPAARPLGDRLRDALRRAVAALSRLAGRPQPARARTRTLAVKALPGAATLGAGVFLARRARHGNGHADQGAPSTGAPAAKADDTGPTAG